MICSIATILLLMSSHSPWEISINSGKSGSSLAWDGRSVTDETSVNSWGGSGGADDDE